MVKFRKRSTKVTVRESAAHPGQRSFVAFISHVRPDYSITPQVRLIASKVEGPLIHNSSWLRLIINLPPGTGKTWVGKLLLAWVFGLHPDWHELILCLSADLAKDIGGDVRSIIQSTEYQEIFPGVRIPRDSFSKKHFEVVDRGSVARGEFNAAGRSTRFTGRRGRLIYQDDLINEKEADSAPAQVDARNTIDASRSRGHPAGFHWIVVNTRYREDDPIGYILDKYKADGPWDMVTLPVIFEKGDLEHSAYAATVEYAKAIGWNIQEGDVLPFYTLATVTPIREGQLLRKPHEWFGQYKGLPRPPTGRKVDGAWFGRYEEPPSVVRKRCDRVIMTVDSAVKDKQSNDPTAIQIWGEQGQRKYLLEAIVDRMLFDALIVRLARVAQEWKPHLAIFESAGSGAQAADHFWKQKEAVDVNASRQRIPWNVPIELVPPVGSKELRFYATIPEIRQGNVFLPQAALWLEPYLNELLNFPRVMHDDAVDATAMFLKYAIEHSSVGIGEGQVPADIAAAAIPGPLRTQQRKDDWTKIRAF